MSFWERVHNMWRRSQEKNRIYDLDDPLYTELIRLSIQENHTQEEITANVLAAGISQFQRRDELLNLWRSLSPREQTVTAYTCLGLTNRQIAGRMGISSETVKSYLVSVLRKLRLDGKADLRVLFAGMDFEEWISKNGLNTTSRA